MIDNCKHCTCRGDMRMCEETSCFFREHWWGKQKAKQCEELASALEKVVIISDRKTEVKMDNREKARIMANAIMNKPNHWAIHEVIKVELDKLDAPEPEKWKPREGNYHVGYFESRMYPTSFEAERAKPLHLRMDRLVNWLVEHCPLANVDDVHIARESIHGHISVIFPWTNAKMLKDKIDSGEVEL